MPFSSSSASSLPPNLTVIKTICDCLFGRVLLCRGASNELFAAKVLNKRAVARKKCLKTGRSSCEDAVQEISVLKALRASPHPSLMHSSPLADDWDDETSTIVLLPYCAGGDVFEYIRSKKLLPLEEAKTIFIKLLEALRHLHEVAGFAHFDISLENLLLKTANCVESVVLCDYGMSRDLADVGADGKLDLKGTKPGKLAYMAPEVFNPRTKTCDPVCSDLYSCGVCLFILLTGAPPYSVPSMTDMWYRFIRQGRLVEMVKVGWKMAEVEEEGLRLVEALLSLSPAQRPTIEEMLEMPWLRETVEVTDPCPTEEELSLGVEEMKLESQDSIMSMEDEESKSTVQTPPPCEPIPILN